MSLTGIAKGDADAMAMAMGADVERTYDLSDEATANVGVDDDFTSVQWFESLRRLEEAIAKLEAFEPNVTEDTRVYGQLDGKFTRVMAYDLPPYAPDAYEDSIEESNSLEEMDPERVRTAEEIARSIASDSGSVIDTGSNNGSDGESSGVAPGTDADQSDDVVHATTHTPVSIDLKATVDAFRMRRSTGRSTRSSNAKGSFEKGETGSLESENTFDSSDESTFDSDDDNIVRAGPGADFPLVDEAEMLSMYDELLKMLPVVIESVVPIGLGAHLGPVPAVEHGHGHRQGHELAGAPQHTGGAPLVVKLLEGTQGIGVVLCETAKAAESVIEAFRGLDANILVQEFIKEAGGADIRALVVGDKVIARGELTSHGSAEDRLCVRVLGATGAA